MAESVEVPFVQEVFATRVAANRLAPGTDVIIELGGEDAKILFLTNGMEVRMNGSCAGGTGAFIDQMATLLKMSADEMDNAAQRAEKTYTIASRCGVFAKSDVQPLINQGARAEDIAASIYHGEDSRRRPPHPGAESVRLHRRRHRGLRQSGGLRVPRGRGPGHDFRAVRSVGTETKSTVRTVYYCDVTRSGDLLELKVCADGFLYNMVRAITGTVLYAAEGKFSPEEIPAILDSGDRTLAGPTAPPGGLYLTRLWYEDERLNG